MKARVIGLGMGRAHVQAYRAIPWASVLGLADLAEGRLQACAAEYGVPHKSA